MSSQGNDPSGSQPVLPTEPIVSIDAALQRAEAVYKRTASQPAAADSARKAVSPHVQSLQERFKLIAGRFNKEDHLHQRVKLRLSLKYQRAARDVMEKEWGLAQRRCNELRTLLDLAEAEARETEARYDYANIKVAYDEQLLTALNIPETNEAEAVEAKRLRPLAEFVPTHSMDPNAEWESESQTSS